MLQGVCAEEYMHAKAASKIHSNAHGDPQLMSSVLSGTRKLLCYPAHLLSSQKLATSIVAHAIYDTRCSRL